MEERLSSGTELEGKISRGDMQSEHCGWLCDILLSSKLSEGRRGYRHSISKRQGVLEEKTTERWRTGKSAFSVSHKGRSHRHLARADFLHCFCDCLCHESISIYLLALSKLYMLKLNVDHPLYTYPIYPILRIVLLMLVLLIRIFPINKPRKYEAFCPFRSQV